MNREDNPELYDKLRKLHDRIIERLWGRIKLRPPHHFWENIKDVYPDSDANLQICIVCNETRSASTPIKMSNFDEERSMMGPFTQGVLTGIAAGKFYRRYIKGGRKKR